MRDPPIWTCLGQGMLVGLGLLLLPPEARGEVLAEPKLVASDRAESDQFGHTPARSGDVLVAAAPFADVDGVSSAGAVYVFLRDPVTGAWAEQKKLVSLDRAVFDTFGASVAVDGDTVAVGVPNADPARVISQGTVHVFERHAGGTDNWGEVVTLTDGSVGILGEFGTSVAVAGDVLAVGAKRSFPSDGQVTVFERDRGGEDAWGKVVTILARDVGGTGAGDGSTSALFGGAVALDGDLLLIGATGADVSHFNENDGAAYLFARDAVNRDRWSYVTRLIAPEAALCFGGRFLVDLALEPVEVQAEVERCAREDSASDGDGFGSAVALDGDTAVIGARFVEGQDGSFWAAAAYIFHREEQSDQWTAGPKLAPTDFQSDAFFGGAVALEGDLVIVGAASLDIGLKESQGAAYVFERDAGGPGLWGEVEKLIAADGFSRHNFGTAVALDGSTRLVGAIGHEDFRGAVYVSAPTEPPPPPEACQPPFALTGDLANGGVITDPSGVILGAVDGALTAPLPVWIYEVPAPAEPLFSSAVPLGAYYNIGAECTTFAPHETPFALALPVPEGADASRLAVALLAPAKYTVDGPLSGELWEPMTGVHDPENRLFVVSLAGLIGEGATVVLIDHPDLGLPAPAAAETSRSTKDDDQTVYYVRCVGEFNDVTPCGSAEMDRVQLEILQAHAVYTEQGFEIPSKGHLVYSPSGADFITGADFIPLRIVDIRPPTDSGCHPSGGRFPRFTESIEICLPSGGIPSDEWLRYTVRHQLFHKIQFNYRSLRSTLEQARAGVVPYDEWVIEGTADAAVESDAVMRRTAGGGVGLERALRRADVRLTDDRTETTAYPYETQDFWVHLFQAGGRNAPLGELDSFFDQGASTESIAATLEGSTSVLSFGTLGKEYWDWVKNQVMEKTDVTFDGALANPCQLELDLIGRGEEDEVDISWPTSKQVYGGLERLQAEAVKIEFTSVARRVTVSAEGGGGPDGLAYKVYLVGETGCTEPAVVPDSSPRTFGQVPQGAVVYVVLASVQHQEGPLPPLYQVVIRGVEE